MKKRLLSLLLTVMMVLLTTATPVIPVQAVTRNVNASEIVDALGIMNTDKGNSNDGTKKVTRAQFAQMLVNMSPFKDSVTAESNVSLFSDVSKKYWAAGYIDTAINQGWLSGYLDGAFKPGNSITMKEAVNGIIKLLGYTSSDFTGNIISSQMALYASKGLNKNITKTRNDVLTRKDCMNLFYNTLTATTKDGKIYGETLGYTINADGDIDYLSIVNSDMEGPVIVDNNWKSEIPFSLSSATYYKNGSTSSYSNIDDYDVLYYSQNLKIIWAYDNKVTGTISSILPNRLSPTSVVIAGQEYTLSSNKISLEFSTLGTIDVGEIVTILLGKDNSVVDVLNIDEYNTSITGVVLKIGEHLITDEDGDLTYSDYIKFVDANGNEYEQDYDNALIYFTEGSLAKVSYENGKAIVSKYELGSVIFGNNTFSSDGNSLGNTKLASNIKILDLYEGNYISVYPERLAGITLGSSTVYYYKLNDSDEIEQLILANVTGDLYDYGIMNDISYQSNSENITINYLINGESGTANVEITPAFINAGPKGFLFDGTKLTEGIDLTEINVTSIGDSTVQDSSMKYKIAEGISVYYVYNGNYHATTLDKVSDLTKYKLTAYYDRSILTGGLVRVIVAQSVN